MDCFHVQSGRKTTNIYLSQTETVIIFGACDETYVPSEVRKKLKCLAGSLHVPRPDKLASRNLVPDGVSCKSRAQFLSFLSR